ncbi:hypothetical protein BGZ76_000851 [Entomortierella beljakovae]|nr:hypothetical protein BGZ76_000851 [Entomortierella beljakovae]
MPKSSSKRKKEKNADFKKTKLKVGKKKAVSDSFTDTSFKSKAISLPSQSISHDKTALLTNSRNVTFAELITQLKHFSPGTRKDAILGLRDLFHRHPHLLPLHLGILVNAVVRLLIDDSGVVRKALQTFLGEFIPMLHPRDIQPFLPLLVVYTCSAMTHILEDIREDALKFMDLWIAAGGQIVVNGFWDKIIPNYVSLLTSDSNASKASKLSSAMSFTASAGSGPISSTTNSSGSSSSSLSSRMSGVNASKNAPGSQKAKCDVLESLAGFLQEGLGGNEGEKDPYWFLRNSLGTSYARKSFNTTRASSGSIDKMLKPRKKRKSVGGSKSNGRSVRRKTDTEDEDDDDDDSENDSDEESSESEGSEGGESINDESLSFVGSPVVSFSHGQRNHQLFATFPIHPSVIHSTITQTIFGATQNQDRDLTEADCISIKIFPQQGGASASAGSSSSSKENEGGNKDNLGGVQGRLAEIKPLIATLHPLLLSVWLDTAPNVFASSTTIHANHALTIVHLVLKIWGILWRAALARPKKKVGAELDGAQEQEAASGQWLDEYLQSLLRHVLIYFPFGKDTVGVTDSKVAWQLQEMNTTYCELTSLFLLESGVGSTRRVNKQFLKKPTPHSNTSSKSKKEAVKTSYRPSNKDAKKRKQDLERPPSPSSSDYDSEDETEKPHQSTANSNTILVQVEAPPWADQVVDFVLGTLGWVDPEDQSNGSQHDSATSQMTGQSTDFKSQHLAALLPTLWALLNCLEPHRKESIFEALMTYFDNTHVQSSAKKTVLQFLALVIKLQSHPHYTGSFSVTIPGARAGTASRNLTGLSKKERKEQQESIRKMSTLLASSLLKLPKLLWDLGTERVETTETALDLLAWVAVITGDSYAESTQEEERKQFLKTFQSYMALFFCVTVNKGEKKTIMGPFVNLPPTLQRRAIEIVYYSGAVASEPSPKLKKKKPSSQNLSPLIAAVKSCCQVGDLSEETRLYIQETLGIVA